MWVRAYLHSHIYNFACDKIKPKPASAKFLSSWLNNTSVKLNESLAQLWHFVAYCLRFRLFRTEILTVVILRGQHTSERFVRTSEVEHVVAGTVRSAKLRLSTLFAFLPERKLIIKKNEREKIEKLI